MPTYSGGCLLTNLSPISNHNFFYRRAASRQGIMNNTAYPSQCSHRVYAVLNQTAHLVVMIDIND